MQSILFYLNYITAKKNVVLYNRGNLYLCSNFHILFFFQMHNRYCGYINFNMTFKFINIFMSSHLIYCVLNYRNKMRKSKFDRKIYIKIRRDTFHIPIWHWLTKLMYIYISSWPCCYINNRMILRYLYF